MICRNVLSIMSTFLLIFISIAIGIFWSVMPFFGWSYYSQESSLISCCVEWNSDSFNVVSYNISMFVFVFFLPITVITYCQITVFYEVNYQNFILDCSIESLLIVMFKLDKKIVKQRILKMETAREISGYRHSNLHHNFPSLMDTLCICHICDCIC